MSVEVGSVFVAGGLVAAVSRGPGVHEPETDNQNINHPGHVPAEGLIRAQLESHFELVTATVSEKSYQQRLASFHISRKSTETPSLERR